MGLIRDALKSRRRFLSQLITLLSVFIFSESAEGVIHRFPDSIALEALSDTVPFVFSPASLEASDFEPFWLDQEIPGVSLSLAKNSIEWVRVADLFLVPRGRLRLEVPKAEGGGLVSGGFSHVWASNDGTDSGIIEVPVAFLGTSTGYFLSVELNGVSVHGGQKNFSSRIGIRLKGKGIPKQERIMIDRACSPWGVRVDQVSLSSDEWIYIGCRMVVGWGDDHQVGSLETYILRSTTRENQSFDSIGKPLYLGMQRLQEIRPSVYALRLWSKPGKIRISSDTFEDRSVASGVERTDFKLEYFLGKRFYNGFFGGGIGPYQYEFSGSQGSTAGVRPLLTLYGGYFLSEPMRIVLFNATSMDRNYFSDTGLYLSLDQFTGLDGYVAFKLLLGLHGLAFPTGLGRQLNFSLPQGFEFTLKDVGGRNKNVLAGAFLYPPINDRSYYNVWLRWGSSRFFGELNYIKWSEPYSGGITSSSSLGLSVGGHIWSFL